MSRIACICSIGALFVIGAFASHGETILRFSGRQWIVKSSGERKAGPGPNYFSGTNAWVDTADRLHLKITRAIDENGKSRFDCAEVISKESLGLGTYRWYLDSPIKADPNVVLGLFTWDDDRESAQFHHREIDVELISTWGEPTSVMNSQFCVQPWDRKGNRLRFPVDGSTVTATTHSFTWKEDEVNFRSLRGHQREAAQKDDLLREWTFEKKGVPPPGGENVRMNLWLSGSPRDMTNDWEVIISKFEFDPPPGRIDGAVSVEITDAPAATLQPGPAGMGHVTGLVKGHRPAGSKIVLYALGDRWYVQPLVAHPGTSISGDGHWQTQTHGGMKYLALLVLDSYQASATLPSIPNVGNQILAVAVTEPKH